jgi:hypothetical protein
VVHRGRVRVKYGTRLDNDKIFEWGAGMEDLREPVVHVSCDCRPSSHRLEMDRYADR